MQSKTSSATQGVPRTCETCGAPFRTARARVVKGEGRFCSIACYGAALVVAPEERLRRHIDQSGGPDACWPWITAQASGSYGQMEALGERGAHRVAWVLANGPIPAGLYVCHRCDNPPCCNPAHLFLGTTHQNFADMLGKGRQAQGDRVKGSKLNREQVIAIRTRYASGGVTQTALGREYGVTLQAIHAIVHGRHWKSAA